MNKKRIVILLLVASVVILSGCYMTKKRGIVPCPGHGYNDIKTDRIERIASENA
jgi:hypothetical protein